MPADSARRGAHRHPSVADPAARAHQAAYWRANVRYVGVLLTVWFVVSFGFGIVLSRRLNAFHVPATAADWMSAASVVGAPPGALPA